MTGQERLGSSSRRLPRSLRILLIIALALLSAVSGVIAADSDNFSQQTLSLTGTTLALAATDLGGDGRCELLIGSLDDDGRRRLKLYRSSGSRSYQADALASLDLPSDVFAMQAYDCDRDQIADLVLLGVENVYRVSWSETTGLSGIRKVATYEPLFAIPSPSFIMMYDFLFDLNDDGIPEMILPCWRGSCVLQKKGDTYVLHKQLPLVSSSEAGRSRNLLQGGGGRSLSFPLPRITVSDLNTDRRKDILIETDAGLAVYYQTGSLIFADRPDHLVEIPSSYRDDLYFSASAVADINGDRMADYCRVFTQGSDDDYKTLIEVFLGNPQSGYPSRPSKRIVLDEFGVGLSLADLDNQGTADIVVATTQINSTSLVKALLVKSIPLYFHIYSAGAGIIDEQAATVKKVSCGLDLVRGGFPVRYLGSLTGAYGAERRRDLAIISDDDELQIFKGSDKNYFADKPYESRRLLRASSLQAHDLDGDQRDDLLALGEDETGREVLTLLWAK